MIITRKLVRLCGRHCSLLLQRVTESVYTIDSYALCKSEGATEIHKAFYLHTYMKLLCTVCFFLVTASIYFKDALIFSVTVRQATEFREGKNPV